MNRFHIYVFLTAALILQMGLADKIKVFGAKPDFIVVGVVFFALFFGDGAGLEAGIFAGLVKDIFSLDYFGINTLILGVMGFVTGALSGKFSRESASAQFIVTAVFVFFSMSLHYAIASLLARGTSLSFSECLACRIIPTALYTGFAAVPIFHITAGIYGPDELEDLL